MEIHYKFITGKQQAFGLGFQIAPKDQMISVDLAFWYFLLIWHKD